MAYWYSKLEKITEKRNININVLITIAKWNLIIPYDFKR